MAVAPPRTKCRGCIHGDGGGCRHRGAGCPRVMRKVQEALWVPSEVLCVERGEGLQPSPGRSWGTGRRSIAPATAQPRLAKPAEGLGGIRPAPFVCTLPPETQILPLLPEPSGPHPAWHLLAELHPRRVSPAASGESRAGEEARGCSAPSDAEVPRDGLAGAAPVLLMRFGDVSAGPAPAPQGSGDATTTLPRRNLQTSTLEEVPGPSAQAGASEGRAKGPWEARAA